MIAWELFTVKLLLGWLVMILWRVGIRPDVYAQPELLLKGGVEMSIVDEIHELMSEFPSITPDAEELLRISRFLIEMKRVGVAKTQDYHLTRPDTAGRRLLQMSPKKSLSN